MNMTLRKKRYIVCFLFIFSLLFMPAFAEQASAKPIVLKAIGFLPPDKIAMYGMRLLRDKVNERSKGALTIRMVGGPEAIPAFDQANALKGGVMDMGLIPDAYFRRIVPETFALSLTRYNAAQERDRGLVKFLQTLYAKGNIHYLGRAGGTYGFHISTVKRIDTVEGLRGLRLPAAPIATPAFKSLGMVSIDIEDAEIWTALDRGVVGGTIDPLTLVATFRWYEKLKYLIDHPFYNLHIAIMMNLDSWNKLPGNLQNLLTDAMIDVEKEVTPWFGKQDQEARKEILDAGVKPVQFSPPEAEIFMKKVYGAYWGAAKGMMSPESFSKLQQLLQ